MAKGEPGKSVIRRTATEIIRVENDRQGRGKIVVYMAPNESERLDIFHVGVGWQSLEALEERALCDIFFWELADSSLRVRGTVNRWHLHFFNRRTGAEFEVLLSEEETESLRYTLFDGTQRTR